MKLDARLTLFITLVSTFMVCLVVGDLIGGKLTSFHLFGREWVFSVGQLAFPVTFILTDILNEFYGRKVVRRITLLAVAMVGLSFLFIYAAGAMPWWSVATQPDWPGVTPPAFHLVFTQATNIQLASMVAFLIANYVDIYVFFLFKRLTRNRMLWLRATGSTAVSQLIDTFVISGLVWGWKLSLGEYLTVVFTSYFVKLGVAILVTPIIYALHSLIEKKYGIAPAPAEVESADISAPSADKMPP
ncbi:MAG: queuosine precursor transporter [Deltaproteobacteria bacterium]|nr:queuosine precursor transporter [Deltaproteobacteria bacterium]